MYGKGAVSDVPSFEFLVSEVRSARRLLVGGVPELSPSLYAVLHHHGACANKLLAPMSEMANNNTIMDPIHGPLFSIAVVGAAVCAAGTAIWCAACAWILALTTFNKK
jgi:hypothetical protein